MLGEGVAAGPLRSFVIRWSVLQGVAGIPLPHHSPSKRVPSTHEVGTLCTNVLLVIRRIAQLDEQQRLVYPPRPSSLMNFLSRRL